MLSLRYNKSCCDETRKLRDHGSLSFQVQGTLNLDIKFSVPWFLLFRLPALWLHSLFFFLGPHQPATVNISTFVQEKYKKDCVRTQNTKVLDRAEVPMTYKATRGLSSWPCNCPTQTPQVWFTVTTLKKEGGIQNLPLVLVRLVVTSRHVIHIFYCLRQYMIKPQRYKDL